MSRPPSVRASSSEVLVSTSPGKSELIASGPLGTIAMRSSRLRVPASVHASAASAARRHGHGRRRGRSWHTPSLTVTAAVLDRGAERGLALGGSRAARGRFPGNRVRSSCRPSSAMSRNGTTASASRSARPSTLIAFARPRAMSMPECPPAPPLDRHRQRHRARLAWLARLLDPDLGVGAARRADGQLTVLLAVQVQQRRSGHERGVEPARALSRAADLLVHRHQQLERPVRQRLVLGQRHHRRDPDAVVRAERCPVGGQPVALADEGDPALGRIVRAIRPALADHVQMPLEDEDRRRFPPRGGRDAHDEIPRLVLAKLEAVVGGPGANVLDHQLLVPRRARDPGQRLEVPPAPGGLEAGQRARRRSSRQGTMCTTTTFVPWLPISSPR